MRSIYAYISVKPSRNVHERNRIVFIRIFLLFSYLFTEVPFGLLDPWRWDRKVFRKHRNVTISHRCVTSQKSEDTVTRNALRLAFAAPICTILELAHLFMKNCCTEFDVSLAYDLVADARLRTDRRTLCPLQTFFWIRKERLKKILLLAVLYDVKHGLWFWENSACLSVWEQSVLKIFGLTRRGNKSTVAVST